MIAPWKSGRRNRAVAGEAARPVSARKNGIRLTWILTGLSGVRQARPPQLRALRHPAPDRPLRRARTPRRRRLGLPSRTVPPKHPHTGCSRSAPGARWRLRARMWHTCPILRTPGTVSAAKLLATGACIPRGTCSGSASMNRAHRARMSTPPSRHGSAIRSARQSVQPMGMLASTTGAGAPCPCTS